MAEAGAWQHEAPTVLQELAGAIHDQLRDASWLIGLGWLDEHPAPLAQDTSPTVAVLRAGARAAYPVTGELTLTAGVSPAGAVAEFLAGIATGTPRWTSAERRAVAMTRTGRNGTQIIGAFNPTDCDDRLSGAGGAWVLDLPAGTAAMVVSRNGTLLDWVATPTTSPDAPVSLIWHGESADASRVALA